MTDAVMLERIAARRAELDGLEEQLVKQLAEVRVERDELVVAERVVQRISEQGFGEYTSLAPSPEARVGGRSVLLIPARVGGVSLDALPADYQRILAIVREAVGPATVQAVGEVLVDSGELETALGKISQVLADLYRQASQLVGQSEYNRAVVSLISDAVREISNNLAYHLGLAEDVPLPPRVDVTGAMANLTQLHEARSQWEDIPSEENGDTKPDDLAVAGQDVGDGA
jgi:hypothetical protein